MEKPGRHFGYLYPSSPSLQQEYLQRLCVGNVIHWLLLPVHLINVLPRETEHMLRFYGVHFSKSLDDPLTQLVKMIRLAALSNRFVRRRNIHLFSYLFAADAMKELYYQILLGSSTINQHLIAEILLHAFNDPNVDSLTFDAVLIEIILQLPHFLLDALSPITKVIKKRLCNKKQKWTEYHHHTRDLLLYASLLIRYQPLVRSERSESQEPFSDDQFPVEFSQCNII